METQNALAAGQGGSVTILAPQSQDEIHRQSAVEALAQHLARGGALLARCETLAEARRGDRLGPIYAAARLLNANAQVARALAHVGLVERRSRTIVETIQAPGTKNSELNSRFSAEDDDAERAELQREIDAIIASTQAERDNAEALEDGLGI
jgi:hypothetical protein